MGQRAKRKGWRLGYINARSVAGEFMEAFGFCGWNRNLPIEELPPPGGSPLRPPPEFGK
jgi:hypothetical protein